MFFSQSQSTSFKRAGNPDDSPERLTTTGGEGREGLKHLPYYFCAIGSCAIWLLCNLVVVQKDKARH